MGRLCIEERRISDEEEGGRREKRDRKGTSKGEVPEVHFPSCSRGLRFRQSVLTSSGQGVHGRHASRVRSRAKLCSAAILSYSSTDI